MTWARPGRLGPDARLAFLRRPRRPSWCYGTPGLVRAQQLAGLALADHDRQRAAEHALAGCLTDPGQLAQLTDPALCHGWAGVLLTAWHAAADAGTPDITSQLPMLIDAVLQHAPGCGHRGLIEGSAGIALTLHTITTPAGTGWESCLLISKPAGNSPGEERRCPRRSASRGTIG